LGPTTTSIDIPKSAQWGNDTSQLSLPRKRETDDQNQRMTLPNKSQWDPSELVVPNLTNSVQPVETRDVQFFQAPEKSDQWFKPDAAWNNQQAVDLNVEKRNSVDIGGGATSPPNSERLNDDVRSGSISKTKPNVLRNLRNIQHNYEADLLSLPMG